MQTQNEDQNEEFQELDGDEPAEGAPEADPVKENPPAPAPQKPQQPPRATAPAPSGPKKPNIRLRQNMTFEHHLFGSDVKDCLKNTSYKRWQPDLHKVPHKHFFHTRDMRGKALNKSSHACGHYHIMQWRMDPATGNLLAASGPALRDASVKLEDGSRETRPEECTWMDKKKKIFRDDHQHEWEYLGTDILSPGILKHNREANQEEAAGYGVDVNAQVRPMGQARPLTAADGFTVRDA